MVTVLPESSFIRICFPMIWRKIKFLMHIVINPFLYCAFSLHVLYQLLKTRSKPKSLFAVYPSHWNATITMMVMIIIVASTGMPICAWCVVQRWTCAYGCNNVGHVTDLPLLHVRSVKQISQIGHEGEYEAEGCTGKSFYIFFFLVHS